MKKKESALKIYRFTFNSPRGKGFESEVKAVTIASARQKFYQLHPMATSVKVK